MTKRGAIGVTVVILFCGTFWGCQSARSSNVNSTLVAPSPTWIFRSVTKTEDSETNPETPPQPTPTPDPDTVKQGQRLFYQVGCFYCHGVKAEGAVGPRIARTTLSQEAVTTQVYHPAGDMPTFSERAVSRSDVAAIYAYLQSLEPIGPRPEITGNRPDSETGELLYHYFGCFGCHGYQAEGVFGPPLAGTSMSLEEVQAQTRQPAERMPAFSAEWISDEELACIYTFLQSLEK